MTGSIWSDFLAAVLGFILGWILLVIVLRTIFRVYFQSKAEYTAGLLNTMHRKENIDGQDEKD